MEKTPESLAVHARENPEIFGELIDLFEKPLLRYVSRIGNFSSDEAEDVVAESFLKAWKNLNDFDERMKFSSWIYRIAHNEAISIFRKNRARGSGNRVDLEEEIFENLPAKINLEEKLDREMNAQKIRALLDQLSKKYRTVLILFFLEEKSYEEISDILRIPMGSVATLLHRSKKKFRELAKTSFFPKS